MTEEEADRIVEKAVNELREFFPDVQVLVSWVDDDAHETREIFQGRGNWYARAGMANEFLNRDKGQTAAKEIADRLNQDEDD